VGWLLLVAWMVLLTSAVFLGARESTLTQLEEDLESGRVDSLQVSDGLSERGRGYATVELTWRSIGLLHTTQVIEARPLRRAPRSASTEDVTAVVEPGLADRLVELHPDLRIEDAALGDDRSSEALGWRLPSWLGLVGVGLFVSTLLLLVLGPQPWRATRWAWFWLLGLGAPLVMVAYLALGGATTLVPPLRNPSRRLSGGWAFLISIVVGSALASTVFASRS
jgi:hypothetical protein